MPLGFEQVVVVAVCWMGRGLFGGGERAVLLLPDHPHQELPPIATSFTFPPSGCSYYLGHLHQLQSFISLPWLHCLHWKRN